MNMSRSSPSGYLIRLQYQVVMHMHILGGGKRGGAEQSRIMKEKNYIAAHSIAALHRRSR